ncbi:MAG: M3 family oligoendopeptidase [Planctomycetota bacterium]
MTQSAAEPYVPDNLDATTWDALGPLYQGLLERPVDSLADFETWLLDRSELDAAAGEARANLYIRMTCHTDDDGATNAWTAYLDEVPPKLKPLSAELDKRHVQLVEQAGAENERYAVLNRQKKNEYELFREANVPLETQLAKLDQKYDQICGSMLVEFEGEERTLPQMTRYMQVEDRATREAAWRGVASRRLAERDAVDAILDEMVQLRHQCAVNAGFKNFRDYQHLRMGRFDYQPEDCARFHEAIEQHAVPFMRTLDARRAERLGVSPLRPWDLDVDEKGRAPLRPFQDGQDLIERSRTVFQRLDGQLAGFFQSMGDNMSDCFDLDSRKGKASGGYQYMRDKSRSPFIFMNAAGVHRDVETMVHEAGHAFHSFLCVEEPIVDYRHSDIEFAEVASMTMELLTMPYWDAYYPDAADADRARRKQLEGSISILPWIATIDAFQHWMYTNPEHSRDDRRTFWNGLMDRFGHDVSWDGLEEERATAWQRQGHLFGHAFYYIEYGIAQLGALGIWRRSLKEGPAAALGAYKEALSLGGSRPLPTLFETAGVPFDFGADAVGRLVDAVEQELASLPD